jgi:hypothetical protein
MCVDEDNSFLYVSTNNHEILRFKYSDSFTDLLFDCVLDIDLINLSTPTCLNLIKTKANTYLLYSDRANKRLTSIKVPSNDSLKDGKIKCELEWGVTVDQNLYVYQIVLTNTELVCLLNDFSTIQVYDAVTRVLKRDNKDILKRKCAKSSLRIHYFCTDSDYNFYTTNGHSFLCMDINTFKFYQKFKPLRYDANSGPANNNIINLNHSNSKASCLANGSHTNGTSVIPLFESISFMKILTNGRLVLLKDAIQTENSELFIMKPEF